METTILKVKFQEALDWENNTKAELKYIDPMMEEAFGTKEKQETRFEEAAWEATRIYAANLVLDCPDIEMKDVELEAGGFWDGFKEAQKYYR